MSEDERYTMGEPRKGTPTWHCRDCPGSRIVDRKLHDQWHASGEADDEAV